MFKLHRVGALGLAAALSTTALAQDGPINFAILGTTPTVTPETERGIATLAFPTVVTVGAGRPTLGDVVTEHCPGAGPEYFQVLEERFDTLNTGAPIVYMGGAAPVTQVAPDPGVPLLERRFDPGQLILLPNCLGAGLLTVTATGVDGLRDYYNGFWQGVTGGAELGKDITFDNFLGTVAEPQRHPAPDAHGRPGPAPTPSRPADIHRARRPAQQHGAARCHPGE